MGDGVDTRAPRDGASDPREPATTALAAAIAEAAGAGPVPRTCTNSRRPFEPSMGGAVAVIGIGVVVAALGSEEEGGEAEEAGNGQQHSAEGEAGGVHQGRAAARARIVGSVWRRSPLNAAAATGRAIMATNPQAAEPA